MALRRFAITNFRCFVTASLSFDTNTSLIYGNNASGKTSLLEAVFYLAQGRSFRSTNPQSLVHSQASGFRLTGRLSRAERLIPVGVERQDGSQQMRLDGETVRSWAAMAQALPVQLIDAEIHRLLAEGPRYRRRFLDWGAFHVEQGFLNHWRRYQRALRQRNEALRRQTSTRQRQAWDQELAEIGEVLSALRLRYLNKLTPVITKLAETALQMEGVDITYRRGWPADIDLLTAFDQGQARDQQQGSTQYGPHRAEMMLRVGGLPIQECLSRGQHKLLAATLVLAQGQVLAQATARQPTLLLDDLAAELDAEHLARFLQLLTEQPGQKIFTAITSDSLPLASQGDIGVFHVEHGQVRQE